MTKRNPENSSYILIIEDDELVARTIDRSLRLNEFKTSLASSGDDGLRLARRRPPDLVILDVIMPGLDGYEVCRAMRADARLAAVPILFLTAKIRDEDRIAGFLAGADDYLTKPFNLDELLLRVRAILRRAQPSPSLSASASFASGDGLSPQARRIVEQICSRPGTAAPPLVAGDFVLDIQSFELYTRARGKIRLTPLQYELVYYLMSHPGEIFSPARLLDEVWGYPPDTGSADLVRVHIKNLRERVEADPRRPEFIRTVPGFGYTIGLPDHESETG